MRLFVTGGAGYVGSHCVKSLLRGGHEVTVFDNLALGHRRAVDSGASFVEGDLADGKKLREVLTAGRYDGVLHFAAWSNVGESVEQPLKYYRNNIANTLTLLEAMQAASVKRLVFSGTCAVFGVPAELPIREDLPKDPINPYGASKLAVEFMLADSCAAWGLGATVLRYFNASGAADDGTIGEDHTPESHLIPIILQVALGQRANIKIFGDDYPTPDGTCIRDYIQVEALGSAHELAIRAIQTGTFETFNVGTGQGASVQEVIAAARRVTGHAIPAENVARRPGDPPTLFADPRKIQTQLDWRPRYTQIDEIVASAWRWHQAHPRGFAE